MDQFKKPLGKIDNTIDSRKRRIDKDSSIPTLKKGIDVNHVNKLMDINDQLNQKRKHHEPLVYTPVINNSNDQIEREKLVLLQLENEHKQLMEKFDQVEDDLRFIRRNNNKVTSEISQLKNSLVMDQRRFDNLELSITNHVLHREELVNFKIQELQQAQKSEYEEFKFELKTHLETAKQFDDQDIVKVISKLSKDESELKKKLDVLNRERLDLIQEETDRVKKELRCEIDLQINKTNDVMNEYNDTKLQLDACIKANDEVSQRIEEMNLKNFQLVKSCDDMKYNSNQFFARKNDLLTRITTLEAKHSTVSSYQQDLLDNLVKTNTIYNETEHEFTTQENTKLKLENSILDYEASTRVYVNVPENVQITDRSFSTGNQTFSFHKVLSTSENSELLKQMKYFITTNLARKLEFSIVFTGEKQPLLLQELLLDVYEKILDTDTLSDATYSCKAIGIENVKVCDLFDSLNGLSSDIFKSGKFSSQTMLLDEPMNYKAILNKLNEKFQGSSLYNITINKPNMEEFNIWIFDLSNLDISQQANISKTSSLYHQILNHCYMETKCFNLCNLKDIDNSIELLKTIEP